MSSIFQHCYDLMKSSNDKRQSTVKKYDERVQLDKMCNIFHNTYFYYVVYNYDCKLYVEARLDCKWNDGGIVQWSIVMKPRYDHVSKYGSTINMWNDNKRITSFGVDCGPAIGTPAPISFPLSFEGPSTSEVVMNINRDDYSNNPLMLEQQLRQVVKSTFGNRWYEDSLKKMRDAKIKTIKDNKILFDRHMSSIRLIGRSNGVIKTFHMKRIELFSDMVHRPDRLQSSRCYELYLQEMEQEDINTSIRMLF